jgi:transposase
VRRRPDPRVLRESHPPPANPGGNRQANHALWRIVFTRLGSHPATRAYAERRTAEGQSKAEIIRCLKRYVAREVYRHLRPAAG